MQYLGVIVETQENTVYKELINDLLSIANNSGFARQKKTGIVFKKITDYAYTYYSTPEDFLNEIFVDDDTFMSNVNNMDNLIKFMKMYDNSKFPFMKYNKNCIGFKNGVFNTVNCEFTDSIEDLENGNTVRKYIDLNFDSDNFNTPLMDSVLDYQFSIDVREFIYGCLGRMFGIRDNYGFMLYLLGEASTGKSLIIDIISHCFENVGAITETFEEKFGLGSLYDKDIIVTDDLPKKISKIFPQQLFQSCITGGTVSIAVKNGSAINMKWNVPILFAGNWLPDYSDQRQIARRILTAKFDKIVNKPDTTLFDKITTTELPAFINKVCVYYNNMLKTSGNKTVWKFCPEYFLDQQEELKMKNNSLYCFLSEKTRYKKDNVMLIEEVKAQYSIYMDKRIHSLTNGTFHQVNEEYIIENMMTCKSCMNPAKKGCCSEYKNSNRTNKSTVRNLEFI